MAARVHAQVARANNRAAYLKQANKDVQLYNKRHPVRVKLRKRAEYLKKAYGLTVDAFNALLAGQDERCRICRAQNKDWCVDHDHRTGKVRGILCFQCNTGLGCFKDEPDMLLNAAKYLAVR